MKFIEEEKETRTYDRQEGSTETTDSRSRAWTSFRSTQPTSVIPSRSRPNPLALVLICQFPFPLDLVLLLDLSSLKSSIVSFRRQQISRLLQLQRLICFFRFPFSLCTHNSIHMRLCPCVYVYLTFGSYSPIQYSIRSSGKITDLGINYFLMPSGRFIALLSIRLRSQKKLENVWNRSM